MQRKVRVIAPSSKDENSLNYLIKAKEILGKENFLLNWSNDIFAEAELPFFASSKASMVKDLINSFQSDDERIIWVIRGGYGSANLLDEFSKTPPRKDKIFIGFSDATAIHLVLNQKFGMASIHGPTLSNFIKNENSFAIFENILLSDKVSYDLEQITNRDYQTINSCVNGGNLTVITTLIGTKFNPNFANKILLIEDVNEKGYHIHRHLMHLKNSGVLSGVTALIFGEFTDSDDKEKIAIDHFCKNEIEVPCFRIKNIGHVKDNKPIIFGSDAVISGDKLIIENPFDVNFL
jgi:muramoyltetrapeptide carboxypeptidase